MSLLLLLRSLLNPTARNNPTSATITDNRYLTGALADNRYLTATLEGAIMDRVEKFRGDDWEFIVTVSETVDGVTALLDLTGATLTASLIEANGSPGWSGTPTLTDAVNGECAIIVPATSTALFPPGTYDGDLQVVKSGLKRTPLKYRVLVVADVTLT